MFNYILKRMKKVVFRILFILFFLISLLSIFLYLNNKFNESYPDPSYVFSYIENNKSDRYLNETNKNFLKDKNIWAIRLDRKGRVIESFKKPENVKDKFEITDVAKFTRYYLNDYPAFTYIAEDGLLVLAYPKNTLDKFPFNYYDYKNLIFNLYLVVFFIFLFLVLIYIFYRKDVKEIFKNLLPIQRGIDRLFEDEFEKLNEFGELKDLSMSINRANEKYINLKKSQAKWIRGISHDVRTPLSKIYWQLSKGKETLDIDNIQNQVLKISNTIEDLNLTMALSSLNKNKFTLENPIKLIRKVLVDKLNDNSDREIILENYIEKSDIKIKMDVHLFYRMIENILKNSIEHTKGKISVRIHEIDDYLEILIIDEGEGLKEEIIEKIKKDDVTNITKHGLGIFVSKQIAELHDGIFDLNNNDPGLVVTLKFNIKKHICK